MTLQIFGSDHSGSRINDEAALIFLDAPGHRDQVAPGERANEKKKCHENAHGRKMELFFMQCKTTSGKTIAKTNVELEHSNT